MRISGRTPLFQEGNRGCYPFTWEMGKAPWGAPVPGPVPGARDTETNQMWFWPRENVGAGNGKRCQASSWGSRENSPGEGRMAWSLANEWDLDSLDEERQRRGRITQKKLHGVQWCGW